MMTKEQVTEIVRYCSENSVSYKQRLKEIGVSEWSFFRAKRIYREEESRVPEGDFIRLFPDSPFESRPLTHLDSSVTGRKKVQGQVVGAPAVTVELRTPNGALMRISGQLDAGSLVSLVNSVSRV